MQQKSPFFTFFLKFWGNIFLIGLIIIIVICGVGIYKYISWQQNFEDQYLSQDFTFIDDTKIQQSLHRKIETFNGEKTKDEKFIALSNQEFLLLFANSLNYASSEMINIDKGLIQDDKNNTKSMNLHMRIFKQIPIWIQFTLAVQNEERESIKFKIQNIHAGPIPLSIIKNKINNGFSSGVKTVEQTTIDEYKPVNVSFDKKQVIIKYRKETYF